MTPVSSLEFEKADHPQEQGSPSSWHGRRQAERISHPEKAMYSARTRHHDVEHRPHHDRTSYTFSDDGPGNEDIGAQMQEQKAIKILLFFALPCVLLSCMNTAWAFVALVITMLTQPIRLCAKRPTFGQQLGGLLGPTLNLHLRCIYTPLPPHANEDASYNSPVLFLVHIISPFASFCMMFAAWTLGIYWFVSAIVGDPAGQDKRDDGRESVLSLRRWWERWLMSGMSKE
jgi:hypothetical protein